MSPPREPGADVLVRDADGHVHRVRCNATMRIIRSGVEPMTTDASRAQAGDFVVWNEGAMAGEVVPR